MLFKYEYKARVGNHERDNTKGLQKLWTFHAPKLVHYNVLSPCHPYVLIVVAIFCTTFWTRIEFPHPWITSLPQCVCTWYPLGIHLLHHVQGNKYTRIHDAFTSITRNFSFHMVQKQLQALCLATFHSCCHQVNIIFSTNGVDNLANFIIVDPTCAYINLFFNWICMRICSFDGCTWVTNINWSSSPLINEGMHKEANDFLVHERFKRSSTFVFGLFFLTMNLDYTLKVTSVLHLESSGSLNPPLTTTTYLLLNIIFLGFFCLLFKVNFS